jgi:molybdopterin/thiamine biosynthesis adenylyltransferase
MRRPRIKFEHQPVRYGADRIRIGGIVCGIATEVSDPDGWVWALLEAFDGSRTVDQIVAEVAHHVPTRSEGDVRAAIDDLIHAGYIEDADESLPAGLSEAELERYGRGRALFSWMDRIPRRTSWDAQLLLRQAKVVVIGIGGAGSNAALALTASGVGQVHCVEPDVVELSNLNRQILFSEDDLGQSKVEAAVARLRGHNSDVCVTGEHLSIDGPNPLRELATRSDVLLLTADQPAEIRSWANQACHATGTAWVHGGYHGPQVNIGLYQPGTGPCYDCAHIAEQERRSGLPPRMLWASADTAPRIHAANAVSAGIAGYLAAHATMSLITGAPALRVNCQYGFNLVTLQESFVVGPDSPRADCPTCG